MCDQTEIEYLDSEVVWVKLGSCWWPGEVVGPEKLPSDLLSSFRKPPIAVVKFFQEDTYEYVKNINSIYKYNCSRKDEFIKKGLDMYRSKHGHMEKFPEDIIRAENATGGDEEILTRDQFQEAKKESYAGIFGDISRKTPGSGKKGRSSKSKYLESPRVITTHRKIGKGNSDYKVHILVQGSKSMAQASELSTPSTSRAGSEPVEEKSETTDKADKPVTSVMSTPVASSSGVYSCHACNFSTSRLNVMILHNKSHSVTFSSYTPSPVRKKILPKASPKSTPNTSHSSPKARRPRKDKPEKETKKPKGQKRPAEDEPGVEIKKTKTDEEIKSSLLADWDDGDDESNEESSVVAMPASPKIPAAAESPAVPVPAHLTSAPFSADTTVAADTKHDLETEKLEVEDESNKYDFCEDEPDWPETADVGRKIPRVNNPTQRKEDTKSLSMDEDDVAKEVADLLSKTTVPDLPSAPESIKFEENFPEPTIVKSPDKQLVKAPEVNKSPEKITDKPPPKSIFKTKTFFRSRHSRSQDAIGKYVAEQLNAVERMNTSECDMNGSEVASSPETRDSPPCETVKVTRLAPKIQLKKLKAQLAESEKNNSELIASVLASAHDINCISLPSLCIQIQKDNLKQNIAQEEPVVEKTSDVITNVEIPDSSKEPKDFKLKCNENTITLETTNFDLTIDTVQDEPIEETTKSEFSNETVQNISTESYTGDEVIVLSEIVQNQSVEKVIVPEVQIDTSKFMNESTASAVDALLSVSREADRVTKTISDDLPEDLFEDDKVDSVPTENLNGLAESVVNNGIEEEQIVTTSTVEFKDTDKPIECYPNGQNHQNTNDLVTQMEVDLDTPGNVEEVTTESVNESVPSESDLQIAEALMNLPSTALKHKVTNDVEVKVQPMAFESQEPEHEVISGASLLKNNTKYEIEHPVENKKLLNDLSISEDDVQSRFETDQEKSENLNAAQSLVQMSEAFDHKMKNTETKTNLNDNVTMISQPALGKESTRVESNTVEQKVALLSESNKSEPNTATTNYETTSSKLLKMLEEPCAPKVIPNKLVQTKPIVTAVQTKDKILNLDVSNTPLKSKPLTSPTQKIIIRRTAPTKTLINNISEVSKSEKIVLSRSHKTPSDGAAVQTYTIQASPDAPNDNNTIIIQPKLRKIGNTPTKVQKIKPQTSLVSITSDPKTIQTTTTDDALFDINSMPIVLSDDILTPENIEKMPIVMSDGNIISNPVALTSPSKHGKPAMKPKQSIVEAEKVSITAASNKAELKTLLINPTGSKNNEAKASTPNILSKSTKLRAPKPMLVIDKTTGKQKIIMTKAEPSKTVKEISQTTPKVQPKVQNIGPMSGKCDKFIILPTNSAPRAGRTQKIVIDPHSGKAHVLVGKSSESALCVPENKPVSAKLIPAAAAGEPAPGGSGGGTVMIITNAQGTQSRIVLTPEHEKLLFPNKQQANLTQIKTIAQRQVPQTMTVTAAAAALRPQSNVTAVNKPPARIVSKQKSAIITSKGQLIVGGRVATTVQNITPLTVTDAKPTTSKRIVSAEPKKIIQTVQKPTPEPLIFLQQKSGAVMQLTAAQFEHLQRTGQIVQKSPAPVQPVKENKIVIQKSVTITSNESLVLPLIQKQQKARASRTVLASPSPAKKMKKEITLAPAPPSVPPLAPISQVASTSTVVSNPANITITTRCNAYQDFENFEELLPSTAIARQQEQIHPTPAPSPCPPATPALAPTLDPPPVPLSDGQLLAVPGENFGGPVGSFYLCIEDNGTLTPIDNRPLVLENNQLVPMVVEPAPPPPPQPQLERRDILEAALANSDVFQAEPSPPLLPPPPLITPSVDEMHDFRDHNSNVPVLCRVSETSTTLNQPIMTPVEVPSKCDTEPTIVPSSLEDGLAVIGVTPHTVPTSLELPITVTDPRIALKAADALSAAHYETALLTSPGASGEMSYVCSEETIQYGPISMPLLTEEEDGVGKSMPILTDEVLERTASSVESASLSPSPPEGRLPEPGSGPEAEPEPEPEPESEGGGWSRRLHTPGSDSSDTSAEIPLQPAIQISVNDITHTS